MKYHILRTNRPAFIISAGEEISGLQNIGVPKAVINEYLQKQGEYEKAWRSVDLWVSISELEEEIEHLQGRINRKKGELEKENV
jgi:uncharacterized small protein (DUF1192 family)